MISRAGIRAAALAVILGIAASGLTGCAAPPSVGREESQPSAAAPEQPMGQPPGQVQGLTTYRGLKLYRGGLCRCPQPVHYSDAEIKAISAALRALPDSNPLQQAMSDYEEERDNLRICLGR
jgi:hypothetical protein